jgi:hypothetical protein
MLLVPKWDVLTAEEKDPGVVNFVNVDGGTINNEPLDFVRIALAGLEGRNRRKPKEVDRATILIDPFSDPESLGPREPPSLLGLALPFILSLVYQARFKPADIALAKAPDIYSRYLIAPVGPPLADRKQSFGKAAIASGGLGGFLGFVDPAFLAYDYALGRRNAYEFLKRHLALPELARNVLFDSRAADQKKEYRIVENGIAYLPIVPLMRDLRDAPPALPPWPALTAMPAGLSDAIAARLDAVYELARAQARPDSWWKQAAANAYLWAGWREYLRGALREKALAAIRNGLIQQNLLPHG